MIQSSLSNVAIIFFMHLCISTLLNKKDSLSRAILHLSMVILVSLTIIAMFYLPIEYGEYRFDLRLIPLVFLATRWGWKLAIPTLIFTSIWRLTLGGEGSVPGVLCGMILPVLFTLFFTSKWQVNKSFPAIIFLFSTNYLISDLPIIILVPDGREVFQELFFIRYLSFIITASILYFFIRYEEKEIAIRRQLQYYAEYDSLTGLYNIRSFQEKVKAYSPVDRRMYIVMIDIDHFKSINDTYGHLHGDQILKNVANILLEIAPRDKSEAIIGRYGGEEFILFMTADTKEEMSQLVESIRQELEQTRFYIEEGKYLHLTVSIGVSELSDLSRLYSAIDIADQSLYVSKKNGRNRISYAEGI